MVLFLFSWVVVVICFGFFFLFGFLCFCVGCARLVVLFFRVGFFFCSLFVARLFYW